MKEKINGHENFIDFGYRFLRSCWGKGYATEAGAAVLTYARQHLDFDNIYAMTDVDNLASRNVLEKLQFDLIKIFDYDGEPTWRQKKQATTWYKWRQPT